MARNKLRLLVAKLQRDSAALFDWLLAAQKGAPDSVAVLLLETCNKLLEVRSDLAKLRSMV